jgi:hypothetical protein
VQRMDKKHRFHARAGFFVTKKTIQLPTRSLFEWDLQLQSHELTHVASGTFRRNRVGGAHITWGYPRVGLSLMARKKSFFLKKISAQISTKISIFIFQKASCFFKKNKIFNIFFSLFTPKRTFLD